MNRKLLVIAVVPLLVGFAGALAFSSYVGTMTKTFTVQTGEVKVYEKVECVGAYVQNYVKLTVGEDPFTWTGDKGYVSECPTIPECHDPCGSDPGGKVIAAPVEFLGPGVASGSLSINIQYMLPGDWIEFLLIDTAAYGPGYLPASLTSTLTPAPGLAGVTGLGGGEIPASPVSPYTSPATGAWTYLDSKVASTPCVAANVPSLGAINVGKTTSPSASVIGLEYCASGSFGALAPSSSAPFTGAGPLSPLPPVIVGSGMACEYLLIGFDGSAASSAAPGPIMGVSGSLTETVTATSVP